MKLIYSQGYDMWLTQTHFPSRPTAEKMNLIRNVSLLEKLKKLVEQDMCLENNLVAQLEPHNLRITSLLGPDFTKPLGYYDEIKVSNVYPELCEQVGQAEARYMWAMLKNFNEYYAPVIPFIN